jgi:nucleotide-binding universal stress UspA family protein
VSYAFSSALDDFHRARRQAALEAVVARLQGRNASLLSYEEVYRTLGLSGRAERGIQEIPVEAIVGSVGRYGDFSRTFLPRRESDVQRWAGVMTVATERGLDTLPPIEVYKIGEVYFVLDGNHRISVARQLGITHLWAHVVELRSRVPLTPDVEPDDLICKSEYADFLRRTRLDESRPGIDLGLTAPGGYEVLLQQVEAYRRCPDIWPEGEAEFAEAAARWHDEVYLPVVEGIRERGLLDEFPDRTETDLYLWLEEHRTDLQDELGLEIDSQTAAADLAASQSRLPELSLRRRLDAILPEDLAAGPPPGRWREEKLADRYTGSLFGRVLVALDGSEAGWHALEQALHLARLEEGQVIGLHVVGSEEAKQSSQAAEVAAEFDRRRQAAGVPGQLAVEAAPDGPARRIAERSRLADLVVVSLQHPPMPFRLGSGFRSVLQRSARPVLAVPQARLSLQRVLLAFDGSPRSHDALFVATYLAERHRTELTVLTIADGATAGDSRLETARKYLEWHEVGATYVRLAGAPEDRLLETAEELQPDLLLMGGYAVHPVLEVVVGSAVDHALRNWRGPVLVCR